MLASRLIDRSPTGHRIDLNDRTLTSLEKIAQALRKLGVAEPQSHPQNALPDVPWPPGPTLTVSRKDGLSIATCASKRRSGFQGTPPGKLRIVDERTVRVARNQSTFRSANEQIEGTARDLADSLTVQRIPFLCECADDRCTTVIQLTLEEYEIVRASPRRFAVTPGHEAAFADEQVISRNGRFATVEKVGEAGQLVAESDAR